jgi:lipid A 3-O-deacylase
VTRTHASKALTRLIGRKPGPGSTLCFLFLFAAVSVPALPAQEMPHPSTSPSLHDGASPQPFLGCASFYFDNDVFTGNDNKYTGGLGISWTSAAAETYKERGFQRKIVNVFSFLPMVNVEGYRNYLQFMLSTEAYTPTDIKSLDPPPGDHPYAGVLYVDSSLFSMSRIASHQLTLRLGMVGPATGVDEIQTWIHELIGSPTAQGWDTQLKNEPIVNLFYQYNRRLLRQAPPDRFGFDFSFNGGGGVGNYYIGANVGLTGRMGYRLPDNYPVTPLLGGAESMVGLAPPRKKFMVYAFLGAQGFGVLRWLPTDGNTFADSRSGDRDDGFLSLSGGVVLGYSRVLFSYRYHGLAGLQDPENFKTENRSDFGTILLTVFFG